MTAPLPIELLPRAAEKLFALEEGAILARDRSQPLVSFRRLMYRVARDQGYTTEGIALYFDREVSTVRHGVISVDRHLRDGRMWWLEARARLIDAWHEEAGEPC